MFGNFALSLLRPAVTTPYSRSVNLEYTVSVSLSSLPGAAAASFVDDGAAAPEQALVSRTDAAATATSSAPRRVRVVGGMALLLIGRSTRSGTGAFVLGPATRGAWG